MPPMDISAVIWLIVFGVLIGAAVLAGGIFYLSPYLCPLAKPMIDQKQRFKDVDALYPFKSRGFGGEIGVVTNSSSKIAS